MEPYALQIVTNRHLHEVMQSKGYSVDYFEYDGGPAFLNWSGGVGRGLPLLMSTTKQESKVSQAEIVRNRAAN
jgi:hypothetical protein